MSTARTPTVIATFVALATGAAAQTPTTVAEPAPMPGMTPVETVQPVHDQEIFTHVIFSQLEGRLNGANSEFRWEGQGWAGTDYNKLWIKSEGTLQGNGTLDEGQQLFLYSRAIALSRMISARCRSRTDTVVARARRLSSSPSSEANSILGRAMTNIPQSARQYIISTRSCNPILETSH